MPYSQENFDEAYRLREHGSDNATIRMILVSKKMQAADIDELFFALNDALPRKKANAETKRSGKDIVLRDYYMMMFALMVIGIILAVIGSTMEIQILWYIGVTGGVIGFWALGRSIHEDKLVARLFGQEDEDD